MKPLSISHLFSINLYSAKMYESRNIWIFWLYVLMCLLIFVFSHWRKNRHCNDLDYVQAINLCIPKGILIWSLYITFYFLRQIGNAQIERGGARKSAINVQSLSFSTMKKPNHRIWVNHVILLLLSSGEIWTCVLGFCGY